MKGFAQYECNCHDPCRRRRAFPSSLSWFVVTSLILISLWVLILSGYNFQSNGPKATTSQQIVPFESGRYEILQDNIEYVLEKLDDDPAMYYRYMGQPTEDTENAWKELINPPHGIQISLSEAKKLGIDDSVHLKTGGYAVILGIFHNLHCLRRIRQSYYKDIFYPNMTHEVEKQNREHDLHCLESILSSLVCKADLTVHPYAWTGRSFHDLSPNWKTTRRCVNWDLLSAGVNKRRYQGGDLIHD